MSCRCGPGAISRSFASEDWPQFRGPGSSALSSEEDLPVEWGPEKNLRWKVEVPGRGWSSPIVWGDTVYVLYDQGFFAAFEAGTGKPVYSQQRLEAGAGGFSASPWAYGGKVFCPNEDGDTFAIEAGPGFKVAAKSSLPEMFMASPAISRGCLYLRGIRHLYCIGNQGGP